MIQINAAERLKTCIPAKDVFLSGLIPQKFAIYDSIARNRIKYKEWIYEKEGNIILIQDRSDSYESYFVTSNRFLSIYKGDMGEGYKISINIGDSETIDIGFILF